MKFISTRGKASAKNGAEAIVKGLAEDGGLFVPERFPQLGSKLTEMLDMDYAERACLVLSSYLEEYDKEKLLSACREAYAKFDDGDAAPVVKIDDGFFVLELFHGPTLAFKDVALTLLPYLLREGCNLSGIKEQVLILVATSGDTGKAALEGFKDKSGIKISVFYPDHGVSDMQNLQMCTQEGDNVNVVAVKGNFDDCQTAVKKLFSDKQTNAELFEKGFVLSSANSINFGRLAPQIAYYFSAYCDLVSSGELKMGDKVNFAVPTANFGNILAGYYAKQMGLPINKLVCASNANNVLSEFFGSGRYDANREFFKTMSPSMDILVSSNLERLVFEVGGRDFALTAERMKELSEKGTYSVTEKERLVLERDFYASYCDESECLQTIGDFFEEYAYPLDTHTAIGIAVADEYMGYNADGLATVAVSTASPYKFPQSVLKALTSKNEKDAFKAAEELYKITAAPVPEQITLLKTKEKRFNKVINSSELKNEVLNFIGK